MWSEMWNMNDGRMGPILQWPCTASGGKVSCRSARSQSRRKKPPCRRTCESFRVFSLTYIKSSFTTACEKTHCLGFIKRITCQNREPGWERNSALPSLSLRPVSSAAKMKRLWQGSRHDELVTEGPGVPALKLQTEGGRAPRG